MENKSLNFKDTLAIKDLSIAAYLYSCDEIRLVRTERDHLGNVTFHFAPKKQAEQLVNLYRTDNAPHIQPRKLMSSLRDLKDVIFSGT